MARWLVQQGTKNIVLASRRGRASHQVCELIAELETDTVKSLVINATLESKIKLKR